MRGAYPIGVSLHKPLKKFKSRLSMGKNTKKYLGVFNTIEEAFQAYKTAKEKYIKEVSDRWKDAIMPSVYQALQDYQVEISD